MTRRPATDARMEIQPRDQLTLSAALRAAFPSRDRLEELLMSCNRMLAEFEVAGSDLKANCLAVVKAAVAEGFVLELLDAALALTPDDTLRKLRDQIQTTASPGIVDHHAACQLVGRYVMVDRHHLRAALRELSRPTGKRILIVNGPRRTGKSHTTQLISYLHVVGQAFQFVPIDLESIARAHGIGTVVTPGHVARSLTTRLGYSCPVPPDPTAAQWSSWVLDFCDAFEACAMADPRLLWLVVDSFNTVTTMQATVDLIKELAHRIDKNLARFRLVLLGFEDPLATISGQVEIEVLSQIGAEEVVQFFQEASTQLDLGWTDAMLRDASVDVLAGLDPQQHDYLTIVGQRASSRLAAATGPIGLR
ncbi:effector-associated domain EAD1-containing protein [Dactylosporangium sp. NPDC049742]|uniref:effector-associated domain EAD1-containing protein n=1 Tax=Dactylosporangium sp. NPDC049742 TaxID=3154737 RepID=UPI00344AF804